jgi:hypothetical protein
MRAIRCSLLLLLALLMSGCLITTGAIQGDRFSVAQDFSVQMLDGDWEPVRQNSWLDRNYIRRWNTSYAISFQHKKSNGFIGVRSYDMDEVGQARSLEVWADSIVAGSGGLKLSQKMIKVDGMDAIELVISGNYMNKCIALKKGKKAYLLLYSNYPTYFDEYLGVFDKFVGTFKAE